MSQGSVCPWRRANAVKRAQVRQNLGRTGHVKCSGWLEKVALGVDVDEYQGAFEHVFAYPSE